MKEESALAGRRFLLQREARNNTRLQVRLSSGFRRVSI